MKEGGFEAARRHLEHELSRKRSPTDTFDVVYDGGEAAQDRAGVESSIARSGTSADDHVLALVRKKGGKGRVHVVTDDRSDIGSRLAGTGVEWYSCAEFRKQVLKSTSTRKSGPEKSTEKPAPPRSRKQVDFWLQEFGVEEVDE